MLANRILLEIDLMNTEIRERLIYVVGEILYPLIPMRKKKKLQINMCPKMIWKATTAPQTLLHVEYSYTTWKQCVGALFKHQERLSGIKFKVSS